MSRNRQCPLCGKYDPELLVALSFAQNHNAILPNEYRIVLCCGCGFVYDDVAVGSDVFKKYYAQLGKYVQSGTGGSGDVSPVDRLRYESIIKFVEPALKQKSVAIADIGCGKGGLLRIFKEQGYSSLHGFDASKGCMDILRDEFGIPATCVEIAALPMSISQRFDLVVVSNVFEHLYTIHDAIDSIDKLLKSDGFVYVDVPDGSRYHEHFYAPYYSFDMEHINHFNVDTMTVAWKQHGYHCIKSEMLVGTPVPGRSIPMCRMLLRKMKPTDDVRPGPFHSPVSGIRRFINMSQDAEKRLQDANIPVGSCYWGCGAYAKWMLSRYADFPLGNPALIIDTGVKKNISETINDIRIVNPSELKALVGMQGSVIITSVLYERQILQQLMRMHWEGSIYSGSTGKKIH